MTWFSLKRTLQSNLASTIDAIYHSDHGISGANLHDSLRSSAVLLSIRKTTQFCHQDIPLKKVESDGTITYISAIARKLTNCWHLPTKEIMSVLLSGMKEQPQSIWSTVRQDKDGWLVFVISDQGINQWRQQLVQWDLALPDLTDTCGKESGTPEDLWKLQSGYELCHRWQAYGPRQQDSSAVVLETMPFQVAEPFYGLVHCLLETVDSWEEASRSQLLRQAKCLVQLLDNCAAVIRPFSREAVAMSCWFEATGIVLKRITYDRLGYLLAARL